MRAATWSELRAATDRAEALLCDWDGCLAIGNQVLPGVTDFLASAPPIAIVSNNSTMPRRLYRETLAEQGLAIPESRIHLAGDTLLREAAGLLTGLSVLLIASPAMKAEAQQLGIRLVDRNANAVLLMRDTSFDFAKLERAANEVRAGARFWTANVDASHPTHEGITPETGALAAAIAECSGRRPKRTIGKPDGLLFHAALASLGVTPEQAVMIGDNPSTDIAGARAAGIPAVLVDPTSWLPPFSEPLQVAAR